MSDKSKKTSPSQNFPATHWSLILNGKKRQICLRELAEKYWTPVYQFLTRRGRDRERALDLTQQLFERLLETDLLEKADPNRGKFRTYLIQVVKSLDSEAFRGEQIRTKSHEILSLDLMREVSLMENQSQSPEEAFHQEWARLIVNQALEKLRRYCLESGKESRVKAFLAFEKMMFEDAKPSEITGEIGEGEAWISDRVYRLKEKYGFFLREVVQETLDEGENLEEEMNEVMKYL